MRFIHKEHIWASVLEKALQPNARIKRIIVITDDDVRDLSQGQAQFERAQRIFLRQLANRFLIQPVHPTGLSESVIQPVEIAAGIGAQFRIADHFISGAAFFLCCQRDTPKREILSRSYPVQCIVGDRLDR